MFTLSTKIMGMKALTFCSHFAASRCPKCRTTNWWKKVHVNCKVK
jgi:hypothetical protein